MKTSTIPGYDRTNAARQGWSLFECCEPDRNGLFVQRIDDPDCVCFDFGLRRRDMRKLRSDAAAIKLAMAAGVPCNPATGQVYDSPGAAVVDLFDRIANEGIREAIMERANEPVPKEWLRYLSPEVQKRIRRNGGHAPSMGKLVKAIRA